MLLTRKATGQLPRLRSPGSRVSGHSGRRRIDRRAFLKRSGITVGAGAVASQLPFNMIGEAEAQDRPSGKLEVKRTVCTHCSVGCAIDAVVQNGVWVRQEPVFDSPINLGAHCAKGASVREHGITHDSHRLKYPMKLEGGKWKRITWDQAYDEIAKKMLDDPQGERPGRAVRGRLLQAQQRAGGAAAQVGVASGARTTPTTRRASATRTTVAGVAKTWGYGAMTNSYNDEQNSKSLLFLGSNAAEAHPVSMLHTLHAQGERRKVIVVDPRFTRTAAKADKYVRFRSGTDVPFLFGMLHHIFKNGWEDKKYIHDRVYGMDKVKKEVMEKWTPDKVTEATGMPEEDVYVRRQDDGREPAGHHHLGDGPDAAHQRQRASCARPASCSSRSATSALGRRLQHLPRPRQRAGRDRRRPEPRLAAGLLPVAVPGSWKHWARVWNVDFEWLKKQYASEAMMAKPGMTVSRWIDGVLEKNEAIDQDPNLRVIFFWGHAPNSQTRGSEMIEAMKKLDLMVVIDPYPSASAAMSAKVRKDGAYLLPVATQFETDGSATASNRSLQWREKVIEPLFESRTDHMIMYQLAEKLGFGDQFLGKKDGKQNIRLVKGKGGEEPSMEDTLRNEINRGAWTIGYTGQSPERLQAHMRNMHVFDVKTLRAQGRQGREDRLRPHRRLLRPAVAVLRHREDQAPGLAEPVRHAPST